MAAAKLQVVILSSRPLGSPGRRETDYDDHCRCGRIMQADKGTAFVTSQESVIQGVGFV